jgi:hypothetical protein
MIDEELLNRELDGQTTPEESRHLREALRREPEAQARFDELKQLWRALEEMPRPEPPARLLPDVMGAVRAKPRRVEPRERVLAPVRAALSRRPGLGLGLAFAAGMLLSALAVGLSGPWGAGPGGEGVGTMFSWPRPEGREIDRTALRGDGVRAEAVSIVGVGRVLIRVLVDSEGPLDLEVTYGRSLAPLGFERLRGPADEVVVGPEALKATGVGAGEYALALAVERARGTVGIRLRRGDVVVSGELQVGGGS